MNWLGQAGLARYLTDADVVSSNKEVGEVVFYAIHSSLQGGDALSLAMALYDAKTLDPFRLWSDIVAYYDTDINRANIVLFDVKNLLNLRLDPDVTPTSFIANFKSAFYASRSIMQSWQKIRILSVHFYWLLFKMISLRQYVIILFTNQHYPLMKF
jgi:hypothetical protein